MSDGSKKDDAKNKGVKNAAKADPKASEQKDLTGILELSAMMPPASAEELLSQDPFAVNTLQPVEQVSEFESIDQLGMTDHVPEPEPAPPIEDDFPVTPAADSALPDLSNHAPEHDRLVPFDDSFMASDPNTPTNDNSVDFYVDPAGPKHDSFHEEKQEAPKETSAAPPAENAHGGFSFVDESGVPSTEHHDPFADHPVTSTPAPTKLPSGVDGIKNYSERARESSFNANAKNPFHLWIVGNFDPFSRDKLLLFITENPMGLNSGDLDRQINAGRVLLPRISEFAGIKLVQDLRDSGLSFKLKPSSRDEDEVLPKDESLRLQYEAATPVDTTGALVVLPAGAIDPALWQAFDSIQIVQFLKAEIVEVERSELFQELLERMTTSLKNKARLKGAAAIGALVHELKPLRLPSHYQLELKASLLKKL